METPPPGKAGVGRRVVHIVARPPPLRKGSLCSTASSHRGEVGEGMLNGQAMVGDQTGAENGLWEV